MVLTRTEALWSLAGGAAGLLGSIWWMLSTWQFENAARRADGMVIELVKQGSRDQYGQAYAPRFEFQTPDGERREVLSDTGSSPAGFSVGDRVTVLYKPDDPSNAKIDTFGQLWLFPVIVGVIAVIAIVVGITHMQNK